MNVVVVLLLAAAVALSKVVDREAMVSNVKEGVTNSFSLCFSFQIRSDSFKSRSEHATDLCSDRN